MKEHVKHEDKINEEAILHGNGGVEQASDDDKDSDYGAPGG